MHPLRPLPPLSPLASHLSRLPRLVLLLALSNAQDGSHTRGQNRMYLRKSTHHTRVE